MGIIHAFISQYRKQLIRKALAMINGGLLGDASKMKTNLLTALHFIAEAWRQITPTTIQNCFKKYVWLFNQMVNTLTLAMKR